MAGTRKRDFVILEVDKCNIYEVTWDYDKSEELTEAFFDNYTDAFYQYEHLKKLKIKNVTLKVILLPFARMGDE